MSPEATESFIEHCDVHQWVINTHSLHNGHLLHHCLPQDLVVPVPILDPTKRKEEHCKIATVHRPKRDAKYAEMGQKQTAKRLKMEAAGDTKVLGKWKAISDRDGVEVEVVRGSKV